MARAFSGAVLAALLGWAAEAHAQADKRACLATYVDTQSNRQAGRLMAARAAAVTCGSDSCPSVLRNDCVTWLRELDAAIPTVVLSASAGNGHDVTDARITVDGQALVARTLGEAIAIDPGEHVMACEADGYERVTIRLVVAQGAKNRAVHFDLQPVAGAAQRSQPAPTARPIRPAAYVLGAVGIVGLGVWGAVGASAFWGSPSVRTLDRCKPNCDPGDRSDVERKLDVADVAGGTALVALGAALVLYITRPAVALGPAADLGTWTAHF